MNKPRVRVFEAHERTMVPIVDVDAHALGRAGSRADARVADDADDTIDGLAVEMLHSAGGRRWVAT